MQTDNRLLTPANCMDVYELHFCKIIVLSPTTVELIVNDGVEMTCAMVRQYHEFLSTHLQAPIYQLVNRVNSYSYDFQAQRELGTIPEVKAVAVVSYNRITDIATHSLAALPREADWTLEIFSNREAALAWLNAAQFTGMDEAL